MDFAIAHAALGNERLRLRRNRLARSPQHRDFQTLFVIQVNMQRGDG
jgi:hypothetical protein